MDLHEQGFKSASTARCEGGPANGDAKERHRKTEEKKHVNERIMRVVLPNIGRTHHAACSDLCLRPALGSRPGARWGTRVGQRYFLNLGERQPEGGKGDERHDRNRGGGQ